MEIFNKDRRDGYLYDPIIKGFDASFWSTTTGVPSIASNNIRLNAAAISSYLQHEYADVEFMVTVPANPTAGDVRQWGLRNPASDNGGAAYFDITGAVFSFKTADNSGAVTTTALTWVNGTYTANPIAFRLRWEPDQILVYIGGVKVATINLAAGNLPAGPLAARIVNSNADNMDIGYMRVRNAAAVI